MTEIEVRNSAARTLDELAAMPADRSVRVVVKPVPVAARSARSLAANEFASQSAYRSALLAQRRAHAGNGAAALAEQARSWGLHASPASALNAVMVEGPSGVVVDWLRQAPHDAAVLDRLLEVEFPDTEGR